jgi:phosphoheptose isomerase
MTKRIALISEHASPLGTLGGVDNGGQNVYVGQVARHLAAIGYEVDVFTRRDNLELPEETVWVNGVRIIHVPAGPAQVVPKEELLPFMGEFTEFFLEFVQRQARPYDLVHANFWMSGLVACEVKKALGIPFVVTFHALGRVRRQHQAEADGFPDERFSIEDRIVGEADHIIAECPQDEEDLIRLYNADPSKVGIIPCGFDQTELWPISKPLARVALGFNSDERIILQLGRMVRRKGVDNAIRGFARLIADHQMEARLVIVGGESDSPDPLLTPEIGRLQNIAKELGVADKVTFVGRCNREALKYYYSAADIFISTPWYEPFGITPIEAMACGTPVVGANVGGIKFTVRDGETGYLVPPNEPAALAERLAHLYRHPNLLSVFRRQAIRRANDLFTWQKVASHVAALYEEVLAANQPATREEADRLRTTILEVADLIADCFANDGKIMMCGNGGSAADSQHFAAEFLGRFKVNGRQGLPALSLSADSAFLTAWSNDIGYEDVFARQVEAFGRTGDLLLGISTSGRSRNLIKAFETAHRRGIRTIALLGGDGGDLRPLADLSITVPSSDTQHIQEVQIVLIHMLCELVEEKMIAAGWVQTEELAAIRNIWDLPARRQPQTVAARSRNRQAAKSASDR